MGRDFLDVSLNQKETVDDLRHQWRQLWHERLDDHVRAEGVAVQDYRQLFIDKGTVIHATRDCQTLNFKEILKKHAVSERYFPPDPLVGGWTKFTKTHITKNLKKPTRIKPLTEKNVKRQLKKNGRGWLHA